jgi:hypothetical protein
MRMWFTLTNNSGAAMCERFAAAIKKEGVGYDSNFHSEAQLSKEGCTWTTAWSGFTYTIMNPGSSEPARVEYSGAARGFLRQNLIPEQLRKAETSHAMVVEGSALGKHRVAALEHVNARKLARAYGLLQQAAASEGQNDVLFRLAFSAVDAVEEINAYLKQVGVASSATYASASANTGQFAPSNVVAGDPAIYVAICPGGIQVQKEFHLGRGSTLTSVEATVKQVKGWIDRLMPVLTPSA